MRPTTKHLDQEDSVIGKAYDSRLMKRLFQYLHPYRWVLLIAVGLLLGTTAAEIVGPLILRRGIDQFVLGKDFGSLGWIALLFVLVTFLGMALRYIQTYTTSWVGERVVRDLRAQLFDHLQRLPIETIDTKPVGWWMTRLTNDVQNLYEMFSTVIVAVVGDMLTLVGIIGVMFIINWRLAFVTFIVLPLLVAVSVYFRKRVRVIFRRIREAMARLNGFLQEQISGVRTIQLFNRQSEVISQFALFNAQYQNTYLEAIRYYAFLFPAVTFILSLATALILWSGGRMNLEGLVTWGTLVAFLQYSERFFRPIRDLAERYTTMQSAMTAAERIFWLLDLPVESNGHFSEKTLRKPVDSPGLDTMTGEEKGILLERVDEDGGKEGVSLYMKEDFRAINRGEIECEDVWFGYREGEPIIKGVSFRIDRGEKVAIVGLTGAGKSTIAKLLLRFWVPSQGKIWIKGKEIREWDLKTLRHQFGVVLQDPFLFSGTISENLFLEPHRISDADVIRAIELAGLSEWIAQLPQGLLTPVGERGSRLSAGQRQLISIMRVIVSDPSILILDEATSSVDIHTEHFIQQALNILMKERTSLIIAHRLSTVRDADKIIVLHKGKVREIGRHSELIEQDGLYSRLYRLQFADTSAVTF